MNDKRMLVVSAHAADFCTRAGGTIIKYVKNGWDVFVIVLTYGEKGESGGFWKNKPNGTLDECKKIRHVESEEAAKVLGTKIEFYGYNDYPLSMDEDRIITLTRRILELRPEIILTHWIEDPLNMDHQVTSKSVIRAISSAAQLGALPNTPAHYFPNVYFFESTVPHPEFNNFKPDTFIDIEDNFEIKIEAIKKFSCQPQLVSYYTHFALHRGFQASDWAKRPIKYAEGFIRYLPYVGKMFPLLERE
jgi:4-oxalomesaconate hydratase